MARCFDLLGYPGIRCATLSAQVGCIVLTTDFSLTEYSRSAWPEPCSSKRRPRKGRIFRCSVSPKTSRDDISSLNRLSLLCKRSALQFLMSQEYGTREPNISTFTAHLAATLVENMGVDAWNTLCGVCSMYSNARAAELPILYSG